MPTATLHTLNKPESHAELNEELARVISPDDALLLLEDGVYQALRLDVTESKDWSALCEHVYILEDDLHARGLKPPSNPNSTVISYLEFVKLCVQYDKIVSWY